MVTEAMGDRMGQDRGQAEEHLIHLDRHVSFNGTTWQTPKGNLCNQFLWLFLFAGRGPWEKSSCSVSRMTIGQVINIDPIVCDFNGEEGI